MGYDYGREDSIRKQEFEKGRQQGQRENIPPTGDKNNNSLVGCFALSVLVLAAVGGFKAYTSIKQDMKQKEDQKTYLAETKKQQDLIAQPYVQPRVIEDIDPSKPKEFVNLDGPILKITQTCEAMTITDYASPGNENLPQTPQFLQPFQRAYILAVQDDYSEVRMPIPDLRAKRDTRNIVAWVKNSRLGLEACTSQ